MASIHKIAAALDRTMSINADTLAMHGKVLRRSGRISSGLHIAPHEAVLLLAAASVPVRVRGTAAPLACDYLALGIQRPEEAVLRYTVVGREAGAALVAAPTFEAALIEMIAWAPRWAALSAGYVAEAHPGWDALSEDQRSEAVNRYWHQSRIELRRDPQGIYASFNPLPDLLVSGAAPSPLHRAGMEAHPRKVLDAWIAKPNADWQMCSTIGLITLLTLHAELYLPQDLTADELQNAELPELRHPVAEATRPASTLH